MKPIAVKVDKQDNVVMTFNEFKRALDEAYRQGKEDASYKYWTPYTGISYTYYPSSITTATTTSATVSNTTDTVTKEVKLNA